jgi:hypothetical protein
VLQFRASLNAGWLKKVLFLTSGDYCRPCLAWYGEMLVMGGNMGRLECKLLDAPPPRQLAQVSTHLVDVGLRIEDRKLVKERKLRAIHERVCLQVPMQRHVCPGGTL